MDSGAMNNFVSQREVEKLGLMVAKSLSKLKAMNSETKLIQAVQCWSEEGPTNLRGFLD